MQYWVQEALKTVTVLMGKGGQLLFKIQATSALKELSQPLGALVSLGL